MNPFEKEVLTNEYMPVVEIIVSREIKKLGIESPQVLEEMRSYALEGLAIALNRFDPSRNTSFSTYADRRVRGAIYDGLSQSGWFPRALKRKINFYKKSASMISFYGTEPPPCDKVEAVNRLADKLKELATAYVTTYTGDCGKQPSSISAEADIATERLEFRKKIDACINKLQPNHQEVVRSYFFLEQSLPEIASRMDISTSWASKLLSAALGKMRKSFGRQNIEDAIESFENYP